MALLYSLTTMGGFSHCWGSKEGRKEQFGTSAYLQSTPYPSCLLSIPYVSIFLVNFLSLHPSVHPPYPSLHLQFIIPFPLIFLLSVPPSLYSPILPSLQPFVPLSFHSYLQIHSSTNPAIHLLTHGSIHPSHLVILFCMHLSLSVSPFLLPPTISLISSLLLPSVSPSFHLFLSIHFFFHVSS